MRVMVVYESGTGFTRQYAEWIGEDLNCPVKPVKEVSVRMAGEYDLIIYGGWIMGNMIMGLGRMKKMNPKRLVVFAVGASPENEKTGEEIQSANQTGDLPFYYLEGGLRYERLGFVQKMLLRIVRKSRAKKENKTEREAEMVRLLASSFDHAGREKIRTLVQSVTGTAAS